MWVRPALVGTLAAALAVADSNKELMTLCMNCTAKDGCAMDSDPESFDVPVGRCFSPQQLFPHSRSWGKYDVLDTCSDAAVKRTFYASTDGSCENVTDSYVLQTGV
jgi:hypothetical protein